MTGHVDAPDLLSVRSSNLGGPHESARRSTVFASPPAGASLRDSARRITGDSWISLVAGVAWLAAALVILQFDEASVTTVGNPGRQLCQVRRDPEHGRHPLLRRSHRHFSLVFAGIWALMQGIDGIVRGFGVHRLHRKL